jgi:acetylornithine deacetylase
MDAVTLTRQLVDIESISGNEAAVGNYLYGELCRLGYQTRKMAVEGDRFNVYATSHEQPEPVIVFSTHMDTVPPFIPSSEDAGHIYGRGSCDAKGIIAAQVAASERLHKENIHVGLLFVVGEERDSLGAKVANDHAPAGCKFLINGEPTENHIALASKGTLRVEVTATGRMAHSAYPELGESAIDKLLSALDGIRRIELPVDELLGPSTLNIGTLAGGRAPNIIADQARAEVMIRLVGDSRATRQAVAKAVAGCAEAREVLEIPAVRLGRLDGFETTVVAYTTDIPAFGGSWGQPFLIGPGTIHVAHTLEERVPKRQLVEAVEIYQRMVKQLWKQESKLAS